MRVTLLIVIAVLSALLGVSGCAHWSAEQKAPPLGRMVDAGGERLHVVDLGPRDSAKPPLLLIHGASVNLRDMKMALGDRLAQDRRVILIDRPGRGYSTRGGDGWRLAAQAELIHAAVEAAGVERPVVVGQSLGGAVALRYALDYQDDVGGLVVLAPVSHEWPGGVAWYNSVSQWPVAGLLLRRLVIPAYGQLSAQEGVAKSFAPNMPPDGYYENSGLALLFRANDFKSNAADLAHLKAEIVAQQGRYGELVMPVAIVTGADDSTVSPDLHSKRLAAEIPGSTLTLLPGTGHALHHAETDRIVAVIEEISESAR